jgi:hypothetical protein
MKSGLALLALIAIAVVAMLYVPLGCHGGEGDRDASADAPSPFDAVVDVAAAADGGACCNYAFGDAAVSVGCSASAPWGCGEATWMGGVFCTKGCEAGLVCGNANGIGPGVVGVCQ